MPFESGTVQMWLKQVCGLGGMMPSTAWWVQVALEVQNHACSCQ